MSIKNNHFSIILPIYNTDLLAQTLHSIFFQENFDITRLEILVIDDGSDECYVKEYKRVISNYWILNIKFEHIGEKKWEFRVNKSRNTWIKLSENNTLIFIDGDCLLPCYYFFHISKILEWKTNHKEIIVWESIWYNFSSLDPINPQDILDKKYFKYQKKSSYDDFRRNHWYKDFWQVFLWWNVVIDKNIFSEVWGWDEELKTWWEDDIDMWFRLHKSGYSFSLKKGIEVYNIMTSPRLTRENFYSILKNQLYLSEKFNNKEYISYARNRFIYTDLVYKKGNVPFEFSEKILGNNFYSNGIIWEKNLCLSIRIGSNISKDMYTYIFLLLKNGIGINFFAQSNNQKFKEVIWNKFPVHAYFFTDIKEYDESKKNGIELSYPFDTKVLDEYFKKGIVFLFLNTAKHEWGLKNLYKMLFSTKTKWLLISDLNSYNL